MKQLLKIFFLSIALLPFTACQNGGGETGTDGQPDKTSFKDEVVIHNLSDPEGLHPSNVSDATATEMKRYLFQKLLGINITTLELIPWMAKTMPVLDITNGGTAMTITYELKEDMKWDDGTPITARDVEFSFMAAKNPKVDAPHLLPYLDFIVDFEYLSDYKFKFICDDTYFLWDHVTGNDPWIVPEHKYDPAGLMKNKKLKDFAKEEDPYYNSAENLKFAEEYNSIKYHREPEHMFGSGPYKMTKWVTNQRVIFERKKDWYGDKYANSGNMFFDAGPASIIFETVNDWTATVTSLKSGDMDIASAIPPAMWVELPESKKFTNNFYQSTPPFLYYSYIGMNRNFTQFSDKRVRQALSHLVDADNINKSVLYNLQERVTGPIHPSVKGAYNTNLKPVQYDLEKAKSLMAEAGWSDSNGNGILDKTIDGELVEFEVEFTYNQGNDIRKQVGLTLKESARQAGIDIDVKSIEWSVFLDRLKKHKIQMWYGAWVFDPRPPDPKQLWHSDSYNGGSNYTGFGTVATDKLIEDIRKEMDTDKRNALYHKWQDIHADDVPYIYLFTTNRRNAFHKRLANINPGARDPGYWGGAIQLAPGFSADAAE